MRHIILAGLIVLTMPFTALAQQASGPVYGLWKTESGSGWIDIADCGDGTPCGTLVKVILPDGKTNRDAHNPDPSLRDRSLEGVSMIWSFERRGDHWVGGRIYNPENGKTYRSSLNLNHTGSLEVKGCIGPFCKTQIWTPASPSELDNH